MSVSKLFSKFRKNLLLIIEFKSKLKNKLEIENICKIKNELPYINSYIIEIPKKNLHFLKKFNNIKSISPCIDIYSSINQAINSVKLENREKYTGKGVGIAILDTGISKVNDFILPNDRIIAFKDFVYENSSCYDDNGHGTHVT